MSPGSRGWTGCARSGGGKEGNAVMDEHRIRHRAYEIWEQEGRPEGRRAEHWERACRELQDEEERAGRNARETGGNPAHAPADSGAGI